MSDDDTLHTLATRLTDSGLYRVLRKIEPKPYINEPDGTETRLAVFVDTETTGLDPAVDEVIELAIVPFTYGSDGRIFEVREAWVGLREPTIPITAAITAITGITADAVAGKTIDLDEVARLIENAAPIISHHAAFDRPFLERLSDDFRGKAWACSMSQIDWIAEGYRSRGLVDLITSVGLFCDSHQAIADCLAGITMLSTVLPKSGNLALAELLSRGRRPTVRIWAQNSPFPKKDILKARGYRWDPREKCWHIAVDEPLVDAEVKYLQNEIYGRDLRFPMKRITAFDRFSIRDITG